MGRPAKDTHGKQEPEGGQQPRNGMSEAASRRDDDLKTDVGNPGKCSERCLTRLGRLDDRGRDRDRDAEQNVGIRQ